jgi:hypothetical protein
VNRGLGGKVPTDQIVSAYLQGKISRRTFVRRLTAAGVGLSAAIAYSQLLTPEWAQGAVYPDYYDHYCEHYDHYCPENPPQQGGEQQGGGQQGQAPSSQQQPPQTTALDTTAPSIRMRLSGLSLATILATGRFIVRFTSSEPAQVTVVAQLSRGGASRAVTVARGTARFRRAGTKKIAVKLTRRGRRILRRRRAVTLTLTARAVDVAGNQARHRRRIRLFRRRR